MLFMGEEFSASTPFQYFTQHEDEELGHSVSKGRKNEFAAFGWNPDDIPDPQDEQTFLRSKLNWSEVDSDVHADMLDWYRRLIAVRKQLPALTDGRLDQVDACYSETDCWFVLTRGPVQVACNLSRMMRPVPVNADVEQVLSSDPSCRLINGSLEMPPESVSIVTMIA